MITKRPEDQIVGANINADVEEGGNWNVDKHISESEEFFVEPVDKSSPSYIRIHFDDSRWKGTLFSVFVLSLEFPNNLFVRLASQNTNKILHLVDEYEMEELHKQNVEFSKDVGRPCLAYYTDNRLHRAKIIGLVDDPNKRNVLYVDYGNNDVVDIEDLFFIPDELLWDPEGATLCSVNDLLNTGLDEERLKKILEYKEFLCQVLETTFDNNGSIVPLIRLFDLESMEPVEFRIENLRRELEFEAESKAQQTKSNLPESNGHLEASELVKTVEIISTNEQQIELTNKEEVFQEKTMEPEVVEVEKKVEVEVELNIPQEFVESKGKVAEPEILMDKEELIVPNPEVVLQDIGKSLSITEQEQPLPIVTKNMVEPVVPDVVVEKFDFAITTNPEVVQQDIGKSLNIEKEPSETNIVKIENPKRKMAETGEPQEVIVDLRPRQQFSKKLPDSQKESVTPPQVLAPIVETIFNDNLKPSRKIQKNKGTYTDFNCNCKPPNFKVSQFDGSQGKAAAETDIKKKFYVVPGRMIKKCQEQHASIMKACIKNQEKILRANMEYEQKMEEEFKEYQERFNKACEEKHKWIKMEQENFAQELKSLTENLKALYGLTQEVEIPDGDADDDEEE